MEESNTAATASWALITQLGVKKEKCKLQLVFVFQTNATCSLFFSLAVLWIRRLQFFASWCASGQGRLLMIPVLSCLLINAFTPPIPPHPHPLPLPPPPSLISLFLELTSPSISFTFPYFSPKNQTYIQIEMSMHCSMVEYMSIYRSCVIWLLVEI